MKHYSRSLPLRNLPLIRNTWYVFALIRTTLCIIRVKAYLRLPRCQSFHVFPDFYAGSLTTAFFFEVNRSTERTHDASTSDASTDGLESHFGCRRFRCCSRSFLTPTDENGTCMTASGEHVGRETVGVAEVPSWRSEFVVFVR